MLLYDLLYIHYAQADTTCAPYVLSSITFLSTCVISSTWRPWLALLDATSVQPDARVVLQSVLQSKQVKLLVLT